MHPLATRKILTLLAVLLTAVCHGAPDQGFDAVDGPNVRVMRHEDGARTLFTRTPDNRTLTKKKFSANGRLIMLTIYRMDANGNPIGCKIFDGNKDLLFKVSYGYRKSDGQLVEERMFDARVTRKDPDTGKLTQVAVTRGHCKLQWKADWAMRWAALGVDYEMAGKDLIDSVALSSRICKVLGGTPPEGFNYELFLDEGSRARRVLALLPYGLLVAGWQLGATARHSDAVMQNLIGADVDAWEKLATEPSAGLHLYGKNEPRPGRKMGHITRISPKTGD